MNFAVLALIPTILTFAMFTSRNEMLGWPCAGFWFIFGAYNYMVKAASDYTDINYVLFWFSCVGMTIFCALAAYGLREVKDVDAESDADTEPHDPEEYPDEAPKGTYETDPDDDFSQQSAGTRALRERARKRRTRTGESRSDKTNWGEFK